MIFFKGPIAAQSPTHESSRSSSWIRVTNHPGQHEADNQRALQSNTQEQQKAARDGAAYKEPTGKASGEGEVELEVDEKDARRILSGNPPIAVVPGRP